MEEVNEDKIRAELFELYKHYESVITGQLDFCYKYLNFYTGLLSAITAGTLTGILNIKSGELRGLALIIAPILTIFLAIIGYLNVKVFYLRFIQAWVTQINILAMLNFQFSKSIKGIAKPLYVKEDGSFIAQIERHPIRQVLNRAKKESWTPEQVVAEIVQVGDTLKYARNTCIGFGVVSLILSVAILMIVFS